MADGFFKLPQFQREFVWSVDKSAKLLDSILRGYPIGTFIIWETKERLSHIKNLGNANIPDTPKGYPTKYVLDGQQRLASIFAVMNGLTINNTDYKKIYLNLESNGDDEIISVNESKQSITVFDLLNNTMDDHVHRYPRYIDKISNYVMRFNAYVFSIIEINNYPMEKAVDIFIRINTLGKALTLFEIMTAKTHDDARKFFLATKYSDMQNQLESSKYMIPKSTLLQSISVNLIKKCGRKDILTLDKNKIINKYDQTYNSIKKAIDYFITQYRIPTLNFLPYDSLMVPFQYFFFKNKVQPSFKQAKMLQQYFWRASLTSRFTSGAETKLEHDCKKMEDIIHNKPPNFDDMKVTLSSKDIENCKFSTGAAICKSILCLFSSFNPKSFANNSDLILNESNLSRSNGRNYHHIFPTAYLKKQDIGNSNVIANIALINEEDNLKIGSKSPSEYMSEFKNNSLLMDTLSTHLIDDIEAYGISTNNYELFLRKRSEKIWKELEKRF